jgi:hypothetical protein
MYVYTQYGTTRKVYGNLFEFSVKKYIRNRAFSSWDKIFVDQYNHFLIIHYVEAAM